jgi:hypothetical protein
MRAPRPEWRVGFNLVSSYEPSARKKLSKGQVLSRRRLIPVELEVQDDFARYGYFVSECRREPPITGRISGKGDQL